jgi:tetratricopeptide (TPR) repeat protein
MKALLASVVVGVLTVLGAWAGVTEDAKTAIRDASAIYAATNFVGAQSAYEAVIAKHPEAEASVLATARRLSGLALRAQGKQAEAQIAFAKVLTDYPEAEVSLLASSQYFMGRALLTQGKKAEALEAFERVKSIYPTAKPAVLAEAQFFWGRAMGAKTEAAQEAFVGVVREYSRAAPKTAYEAFRRIEPSQMGAEAYLELVKEALLAVPATEANVKFLGVLKSEAAKLK